MTDNQSKDAIKLLKKIIKTPSFSKKEENVVKILESWFKQNGINYKRHLNDLWAENKYFNKKKPTILLNSHHDTVQPNKSYTIDPFCPIEKDGKIFGLGSNDAGGALVSLLYLFKSIYLSQKMNYNFIIACTAEEEIEPASVTAHSELNTVTTIHFRVYMALKRTHWVSSKQFKTTPIQSHVHSGKINSSLLSRQRT